MPSAFYLFFALLCQLRFAAGINYVEDQTSPGRYTSDDGHYAKRVPLEVKGQGAVGFEMTPCHNRDYFEIYLRNKTNKIFEFKISNQNVQLQKPENLISLFTLEKSKNLTSNLLSFDAASRWIWVSVCPYYVQLSVGIGYMLQQNAVFTYLTDGNPDTIKLLRDVYKDIKSIEIEGAEIASPPKFWKYPVKSFPAPSVSPKVTLNELHKATHISPLQLPFKSQALYGAVSGASMTPDEIEMINYSLDTAGATLNRKLIEKSKTFTSAASNMSYIRVTVGHTEGVAPGLPFVLEIWPKGHFSPVHNHGDTVSVIKVLHGSVVCRWFNPLANRSTEKPDMFGSIEFNKGDVTWLNPEIFQTHQLENVRNDTAAITIQAYSYMGHDTVHYETFDYVVDESPDIKHFKPTSDFDYQELMTAIKRDCDDRKCLKKDCSGVCGAKGEKGDPGVAGPKGDVGPKGDQGEMRLPIQTGCQQLVGSCQTTSDCCQYNSPTLKLFPSCASKNGSAPYCACTYPGANCGAFRCCDGSECVGKCQPAGRNYFCSKDWPLACATGLSCTSDTQEFVSQFYSHHSAEVGRCK